MNKIRRLPILVLLALVCSSICWSQSIVSQQASRTRDLRAHQWSQHNQGSHRAAKYGEEALALRTRSVAGRNCDVEKNGGSSESN